MPTLGRELVISNHSALLQLHPITVCQESFGAVLEAASMWSQIRREEQADVIRCWGEKLVSKVMETDFALCSTVALV